MSQDSECVFCSIIAGDIPGRVVHETDTTLAFLDANPLARGHTLVIPKSHCETLEDASADIVSDVFTVVRQVTPRIESAVDAPASNIAINNGEVAGQEVPHLHVHIVPRFENDTGGPIHAAFGRRPDLSDDDLDVIQDRIRTSG